MENARVVRDMEIAKQIQLSLLPASPPDLPGVRFASCCVPAAHVVVIITISLFVAKTWLT